MCFSGGRFFAFRISAFTVRVVRVRLFVFACMVD